MLGAASLESIQLFKVWCEVCASEKLKIAMIILIFMGKNQKTVHVNFVSLPLSILSTFRLALRIHSRLHDIVDTTTLFEYLFSLYIVDATSSLN